MIELISAAVGGSVFVIVLAIFEMRRFRKASDRFERIRRYFLQTEDNPSGISRRDTFVQISDDLNQILSRSHWLQDYSDRSYNAGLRITPLGWLVSLLGGGFLLSIAIGIVLPIWPLAYVLGFGFAFVASHALVTSRESKRRSLFEQQLPEFLLLISSSLRSGLSLTQSLESVSQQGNGEVERQIRRATSEMNMGMTPNDALMEVAIRMQSADMRWVNVAIAIQREVGGNLSVILDSVADTVSERANIKREVATLSSESRLSAWILLALPLVVFVFFYLFRREYVAFFWTTLPGALMLALFVVLVGTGALWMRSLIKIKV